MVRFRPVRVSALMACLGLLLTARPVYADILSIQGSATLTQAGIDFGAFTVIGGSNGIFNTAGVLGSAVSLVDLNDASAVGDPISLPGWLTVAALPFVEFTLELIQPGVFPSAACAAPPSSNQVCTPPPIDPDGPGGPIDPILSPYNLTNLQTGFILAFNVSGSFTDPLQSGTFVATFSATSSGSYQTFLQALLQGSAVPVTLTGTLETTPESSNVPEPSSALLALVSLVAGHRHLRRRDRLRTW